MSQAPSMLHHRPEHEAGCCSLIHISRSRRHFPLSVSAAAMPTPQQIASFAFLTAHAANTTSHKLSAAPPICFQQTSSRVSVSPCTADRSKTGYGTHTVSFGKRLHPKAKIQSINFLFFFFLWTKSMQLVSLERKNESRFCFD